MQGMRGHFQDAFIEASVTAGFQSGWPEEGRGIWARPLASPARREAVSRHCSHTGRGQLSPPAGAQSKALNSAEDRGTRPCGQCLLRCQLAHMHRADQGGPQGRQHIELIHFNGNPCRGAMLGGPRGAPGTFSARHLAPGEREESPVTRPALRGPASPPWAVVLVRLLLPRMLVDVPVSPAGGHAGGPGGCCSVDPTLPPYPVGVPIWCHPCSTC